MKKKLISLIAAAGMLMSMAVSFPANADYSAVTDTETGAITYTWDFAEYTTQKTGETLGSDSENYNGLIIKPAPNNSNDKITTAGVSFGGQGGLNDGYRYLSYTPKQEGTLYVTGNSGSNSIRWGISATTTLSDNESSTRGSGNVSWKCTAGTTYYIYSNKANNNNAIKLSVSSVKYVTDPTHVSGSAAAGSYTWKFAPQQESSGKDTYNYSDDYAAIRIGLGSGDSIKASEGIRWSGGSVAETNNVTANNRYILIKPNYTGKAYVSFTRNNTATNRRGTLYYVKYNASYFDEKDSEGNNIVNLSVLQKDEPNTETETYSTITKLDGDIKDNKPHNDISFDVEANKVYALFTYNFSFTISDLHYTSDSIIAPEAKTTSPHHIDQTFEGTDGSKAEAYTAQFSGFDADVIYVNPNITWTLKDKDNNDIGTTKRTKTYDTVTGTTTSPIYGLVITDTQDTANRDFYDNGVTVSEAKFEPESTIGAAK